MRNCCSTDAGIDIHRLRHQKDVIPTYKLVDTCAAEFDVTPYFIPVMKRERGPS